MLGQSLVGTLKDGLDKDRVWKATRRFEEEIFTRAEGTVPQSWDNLQSFAQLDAAETVVSVLNAVVQGASPPGSP